MYAGAVEDGERVLKPLREFGMPVLDLSTPLPFRALQQAFDWLFPTGKRYYWKTVSLPALDADTIETIVQIGQSRSSPQTVVGVWQMGGAVARVPDDATGYGPRSDPWTVAIDAVWEDPAEDAHHTAWDRAVIDRLREASQGHMYLHYGALESKDDIRDAYGPVYDRLREVKARYDPGNLFRVNQNIEPATAPAA